MFDTVYVIKATTCFRTSRYDDMLREDRSGSMTRSTVADRALINQHVNPYQEFPSLKRGFTLEGMPIMEKDENDGDACAYYFWAIAIFFFTLAVLNLIVLMVIVHVLEITPSGMEAMEFLPDLGSVKFLKDLVAPVLTIGTLLSSIKIQKQFYLYFQIQYRLYYTKYKEV